VKCSRRFYLGIYSIYLIMNTN